MFSIKTLQENNNSINNNISKITKDQNRSYLFDLLESNDAIHDIMSSIECDMYINATNNILNENSIYQEGVVSNIKDKIANIIQKFIDFITKHFIKIKNNENAKIVKKYFEDIKKRTNGFSNKFYEDDYDSFIQLEKNKYPDVKLSDDDIKKAKQQTINNFNNKDLKFTMPIYVIPDPESINDKCVEPAIANFVSAINNILEGKSPNAPNESQLSNAFGILAKNIKPSRNLYVKNVTDRKTFQEYIKSNVAYSHQGSKTFEEINSLIMKYEVDLDSKYTMTYLKKDLDNMLNKAKNVANSLKDEDLKNFNIYFEYTRQIVNAYIWCQNYINNLRNTRLSRYIKICKDIQYNRLYVNPYKNNSQNEASYIHGEPFNSDTLFDNEDLRDFNRTEWLDLELTTECYNMKFDMVESYRKTILQEALILTDDKPNKIKRLISMKEAEGNNLSNNISNAIANIRKIIDKFLSSIKDKYGANAQFLNKYENDIKNKKISDDAKIVSKGDIIAGMYRVQDDMKFIDYNFETLKEDLKDKETFFRNHIKTTLINSSNYSKNTNTNFSDGMSIIDFCKAYYGAPIAKEDDKGFEFDGKDFDPNKNNIIKFLRNSNTFINSIKSDLNKLEEQSKKINSAVQNNTQTQNNSNDNQNNSNPSNNTKSKQESYYSLIYNKYITEADIDMGTTSDNNGEGENKNNTEASAFKVYMDAYKDVLLSKITAIEFIVNEFMQVLKAHVGVKETPKENTDNKNTTNTNESFILNENIISDIFINKDDVSYNLDKWNKKYNNILYITGLPESGKTKLAEELCKKYNAIHIELDMMDWADEVDPNPVLPELLCKFYDNSPYKSMSPRKMNSKIYNKFIIECYSYIYKNISIDRNNLYIVEGTYLPLIFKNNPEFIINAPVIIKGTSMISLDRLELSYNNINNWMDALKWQLSNTNKINQFKNNMKKYGKEGLGIYKA